jgi:hypothetical protein
MKRLARWICGLAVLAALLITLPQAPLVSNGVSKSPPPASTSGKS